MKNLRGLVLEDQQHRPVELGRRVVSLLALIALLVPLGAVKSVSAQTTTQTTIWVAPLNRPGAVTATTNVDSDIVTDTTWTLAGSPYLVSTAINVISGAVLTVQPGVRVQFAQSSQLIVNGRLSAIGIAAQPITFTGSTAQAGWWYGLAFAGSFSAPLAGSALDYVTVEYGGRGNYGNIDLYYAAVNIAHSTIAHSGGYGVRASATGVAHISDSILSNNANYAIYFADGSVNPQLSNLTISGNGTNAIVFGGTRTFTGQYTLQPLGVPYIFSYVKVVTDATLTVAPGVTMQFEDIGQMIVNGRLSAVGTPAQPITFTATNAQPGAWYGILADSSSQHQATVQLEYATVEYGGRGNYANLVVNRSQAFVSHSLIRFSGGDGMQVSANSNTSIEASHILSNTRFGVNNISSDATDVVIAANNWWGTSSGPTVGTTCNPGGTGERVSAGVAFRPVLTNSQQEPLALAPTEAGILTITPNRWFAPADNATRIRLTLTLRDGNGLLLPGRRIQMKSTLGSVQSGGLTDASGQVFAFVTSAQAGDAELRAVLDATACETARVAMAKVTFTAPAAADDYLPEASAPYLNNGIQINPEPIIRGVPTRLSAKMTNPNNFPIIVDGAFGFAQSGIGLVFGPVGEVLGQVIPANGTAEVAVMWTPVIDGHYCIRFTYSARQASAQGAGAQAVGAVLAAGGSNRNLNVYPGPLGNKNEKDSLNKADKAFKLVSKIGAGPPGPSRKIVKGMISGWWSWAKDTASNISKNLGGDPPRQDYQQIAVPRPITLPLDVPDAQVSPARAAAINEVTAAFLDMNGKGEAATVTLDRYGGAGAAKNLEWTSLQAASLLYYKELYGTALITAAMKLEALIQVAASEGVTAVLVSEAEIRAYQDRLRATGFTAEEIGDAKLAGLTDAQIEANKQDVLAADPAQSAGDIVTYLQNLAFAFRALGIALINPPNFGGLRISGGLVAGAQTAGAQTAGAQTAGAQTAGAQTAGAQTAGAQTAGAQADAPNDLVRVFNNVSTIQVANPHSQTTTIELRTRRVDIPSDWLVTVSPASVTLAPGAQMAVTVTMIPGASAVQGSVARVAVEGYVNGALLDNGGVVIDTLLPRYVFFDGKLHAYLPQMRR